MKQQASANEHLRQAQSAVSDIPETSLTGTAKTRVAELKRHLNALEQAAQKPASGTTASASWASDAAAADRILSELLDPASTTGASTPAPTGTTGSTATAPKTTTSGKSSASMTLDDTARTKLQEVRTHITAFAAAMGSGASSPKSPSTSSDDPSASAATAASSTRSTAGTTGTTAAPAPTGTSGTTAAPAEPTQPPTAPADPAAPAAPPAQSPTQPPTATPETPSPTPSQQVDAETVKRHLTAARDSLSQLTQLPAAAQLTGDARTQVSQLISNFNELITTNVDWRTSYAKVQGNLTALVGEQRAGESPTPATGTPGAVGTSGTSELDPAIRAKLIEFRSHLAEFEKAAGGSGTPDANDPAAPAAAPSAAASPDPGASASPAPSASPATSATASSTPADSSTSTTAASASSTTTTSPAPAATTGSTADTPTTAGTSGTGTPMPAASEQASKPSTSGRDSAQAAEGHRAAMKHIEAIEAILNGASPTGTSGATASKTTKPGTLERAQIEEIRNHLTELRKELDKSNR